MKSQHHFNGLLDILGRSENLLLVLLEWLQPTLEVAGVCGMSEGMPCSAAMNALAALAEVPPLHTLLIRGWYASSLASRAARQASSFQEISKSVSLVRRLPGPMVDLLQAVRASVREPRIDLRLRQTQEALHRTAGDPLRDFGPRSAAPRLLATESENVLSRLECECTFALREVQAGAIEQSADGPRSERIIEPPTQFDQRRIQVARLLEIAQDVAFERKIAAMRNDFNGAIRPPRGANLPPKPARGGQGPPDEPR
jgi:hypothetical protein